MTRMQKVGFVVLAITCLLLALVASWATGTMSSRSAVDRQSYLGERRPGEGLQVSGTAVVRAAPDLATVRLGYESRARWPREAKVANDRVMKKVIAAVEKAGVARKDIQTVEYRLFPYWEQRPPSPRSLTWHVLNLVEVRVRKVDTVADVIEAASAAGADKMGSVQFSVENLHQLRAQAREMAAKIAREKAEQLAGLMGARLGPAITIRDSSPQYNWSWQPYGANVAAQAALQVAGGENNAEPDKVITAGQVVVEAREEAVFALE